jgi:hypothetical protein
MMRDSLGRILYRKRKIPITHFYAGSQNMIDIKQNNLKTMP